jgi:hypothetical protein
VLNNTSLNFGTIRHSQPRFGASPYKQGHQAMKKAMVDYVTELTTQNGDPRNTVEGAEASLRASLLRQAHRDGHRGQAATNYVNQRMLESNVHANNTHAYFHSNLQYGMNRSDALDYATASADLDRDIDRQNESLKNNSTQPPVTTHSNQHGDRVELAFGPNGSLNSYNKNKKHASNKLI